MAEGRPRRGIQRKPPENASAGSRWHLPLFSSVWEHKVSDENTFSFPEAMFQVDWTQEQRTSLLNASQTSQPGTRGLVPFVLASFLTFKEAATPSFSVFPGLSPFSSPSPPQFPFNTFPSPSLELFIAFCLAHLGGTAHHHFSHSPKWQPTLCLALLSPALTVLVYFDQFASSHRSPIVCLWQWVRAGSPRTAKVVPVLKCPQELGSLSSLSAPSSMPPPVTTMGNHTHTHTHCHSLPTSRTAPPGFTVGTGDLSVRQLSLWLMEHILSPAAAATAQTWHYHYPVHSVMLSLR